MQLINSLQGFILDQDYYVAVYSNYIYIYEYQKLQDFKKDYICFLFPTFKLIIVGEGFVIKKMLKREMLIQGIIKESKFIYE
jgi:hypothetical protein